MAPPFIAEVAFSKTESTQSLTKIFDMEISAVNNKSVLMTDAKSRLSDILTAISWREIARTYFGKSSSWLYHKLDGIKGDGSNGGFTPEESEKLKEALEDLASRISKAASSL